MNKPTAVISSDLRATINWLRTSFDIEFYDVMNRYLRSKSGEEFYIVSHVEDILGKEFSTYLVAPDYRHLVDDVKTKIR